MGKWEVIFAITFFVVNGVVGYLAKREKEKARRQAEADAAGLPSTQPSTPPPQQTRRQTQVRVDPAAAGGTRGGARPPASPRVPARSKRPAGSTARRGDVPARPGTVTPKPVARGAIPTPPARPAKAPTPAPNAARSEPSPRPAVPASPVSASEVRRPDAATTSGDRRPQGLRDTKSLRSAIVWAEVLGRPRGLD